MITVYSTSMPVSETVCCSRMGYASKLQHCPFRTSKAFAVVAVMLHTAPAVHGGIIGLIQNNVLGTADFHRQQSWPFDPNVSGRRAHEFIALHGDKSERLIERIGLGIDGRQEERREQQMVRDILYEQQQRREAGPPASGYLQPQQRPVQSYPAGVGYARRR
ncbi:uncharacterized protein LOC114127602 isoform X1 [Aphis gossypii]|uniref:uncharacterized protein LOC114127602 isoform X1 n=1 Tax=Aphis gossypii TaxID=80765 RepID=UPI002158D463|nr:uncharacterized protein LOC114127602 isoform X1 [Aphis gossypii]